MKSCCKTGDSPKQNRSRKYFSWFIYMLLTGIIVFVLILEK